MDDNSPSLGGDRQEPLDDLTGNEPMLEGALLQLPLEELIRRMDDRQRRLFACDCAERVLHLFEAKRPQDKRPREAIAVARKHAFGQATNKELGDMRGIARGAPGAVNWNRAEGLAARAAYYTTIRYHRDIIPRLSIYSPAILRKDVSLLLADIASRCSIGAATLAVSEQIADSVEEAERDWQKQRALWYLQNQDAGVSDDDIE